jgi:[calcium/calmodulin-dependent protein kinase] kinase
MVDGVKKINGKAGDIWALGVTLYCFTHGYCPFEDTNVMELTRMILHDRPKYSSTISKSLVDLLDGMLQKDAHHRLNMAKIKNHHWTTENGKRMLPSTEENCRRESITEEDLEEAFKPAKLSVGSTH